MRLALERKHKQLDKKREEDREEKKVIFGKGKVDVT